MPIHLHPTAPAAERALLPGDPGRALLLAQSLLHKPRMFNHNRGLWGYSGEARDDSGGLLIQSTGMGGPSAAIVLHELAELGVRRALRVGTCGALSPEASLGDLLIADEVVAGDGTSRALGARASIQPDNQLTQALRQAAPEALAGAIRSDDLFYAAPGETAEPHVLALEMEAAALLAEGQRSDVRIACVLAVSDLLAGASRRRIEDEELRLAGERLGTVGLAALTLESRLSVDRR